MPFTPFLWNARLQLNFGHDRIFPTVFGRSCALPAFVCWQRVARMAGWGEFKLVLWHSKPKPASAQL